MMRHLEHGPTSLYGISGREDVTSDSKYNLDSRNVPHGVAPETYGLLLFARNHKEILAMVDASDKGKRIINPTRNLLYVYYFNEVSGRDLQKFVGGNRKANARRILKALEIIWQSAPLEIQQQYPKEKVLQLKTASTTSPQRIRKISEASRAYWQNEEYRRKNTESLKRAARIRANRYFSTEPNTTRSQKRKLLVGEWLQLTKSLGHTPSRHEINKLKREGNTRFSGSVYEDEFSQGSFTKAREILTSIAYIQNFASDLLQNPSKILRHPVLEKDIKTAYETIMAEIQSILSSSSIEETEERTQALNDKIHEIKRGLNTQKPDIAFVIGEDEKSMWKYAVEQNLLPKILQSNLLTQQEIDLLRKYFENGIIAESLSETTFDRFTIAVAKA